MIEVVNGIQTGQILYGTNNRNDIKTYDNDG